MVFMNMTETVGIVMGQASTYTTGSMVASLLVVLIFLLAIAMMFGIPIEYTVVLVYPYLLAVAAHYHELVSVLIVAILYSSLLVTKWFMFK